MPPGPIGLPFLGNVLQFDINNPLKGLSKWKKQFGDIFTIKLLGQDIVVVSIKLLCNKQSLSCGWSDKF